MALETGTFVTDLNVSNPTHTDGLNQADAHMRLIKTTLQNTFPGMNAPVLASPGQLNAAGAAFSTPGVIQSLPGAGGVSYVSLNGVPGKANVNLANTGDHFYLQILNDQEALITNQMVVDQTGTMALQGSNPQVVMNGTTISFPGMIVMFSGTVAQIPQGWHLCDGTNNTPNLIDRFVVCAGGTYPVGAIGGIATQVLSYNQLPAHVHGVNDPGHNHGISDPGHNHGLSDPGHNHGVNDPGHNHQMFVQAGPGGTISNGNLFVATSISANTGGVCYDTPAGTGITIQGNPTGLQMYAASSNVQSQAAATGIGTQSAGGNGVVENRPPYMALCYIMRIV